MPMLISSRSVLRVRAKATGLALLAASVTMFGMRAEAVPVVPGAAGYGMDTPAGRGGTVYKVTNLNETGTGSLRACVEATGPRVCVFETSGTIKLTKELKIKSPYITIAGQTAPAPGIMLRGAGIWILTSHVLVQHLRVRPGDDPGGPLPENRDALVVDSTDGKQVTNIVVDHCSFQWAIDELASAYWNYNNVTFSNSIFAEALNESLHPKGAHGFGPLFGHANAGSVSMIGNLIAHNNDRNPLSRAPRFVFVNNVVYNRKNYDLDLQGREVPTQNSIVGNVFIRGLDYSNPKVNVIQVGGYIYPLLPGSTVYVADNAATGATSDPWSVVTFSSVQQQATMPSKLTARPAWPEGLVARPTAGNAVLDRVLKYAGARPAERDTVDARIVTSVRERNGRIINCVAADGSTRCQRNAGGWPVLAVNKRTLTVPANPNQVGSDGYTNLEKWLHKMASNVEGLTQVIKAPNVSVN